MEHVNLNIGTDAESLCSSLYFFRDTLGFTVDPDHKRSQTLWMNASSTTQIHSPRRSPVQYLHGRQAFLELTTTNKKFVGEFVSCGGVKFVQRLGLDRGLKTVSLFVESKEVLPAIASFCREMLKAHVVEEEYLVKVKTGPDQCILFQFQTEEEADPRPYSGYHICIYINDWEECYKRFEKGKLLFLNHAFDDKCSTLEGLLVCFIVANCCFSCFAEARKYQQFRVVNVPDKMTGKIVFQLELEIRSTFHPQFSTVRYISPVD
jgi:hypothetical protein